MTVHRQGISPVLAFILLIVLVLGATGGFAAWYFQAQEGFIDRFFGGPSMAVITIECEGNLVNVTLDNTGDVNADASTVNAYLYEGEDLISSTTKDFSGKGFAQADGRDFAEINFSAYMQGETFYGVTIEFPAEGYAVETSCVGNPFAVGEASAVFTTDGDWEQVSFDRPYTDPVVVATPNTNYTTNASGWANRPLIPQVKNVTADGAWLRLCDHDNTNGCASHQAEVMGYVAVDAAALNSINETEAGTVTIGASGGESSTSVSFDETFQGDPVVFVTANTNNNETSSGWGEFSTWVTSNATSTGFDVTRCNHDEGTNNCESHQSSEDIGWFAVNPERMALLDAAAGFTSALPGDQWERVDLDASGVDFATTPIGLAAIQGNAGGEDPKVSEAVAVSSSALDIHFCEHDSQEWCDAHSANFVAWLAVKQGPLVANNSFIP